MARTILITDGTPATRGAGSGSRWFAECIAARQSGRVVSVETTDFLDDVAAPDDEARAPAWKTIVAPRDLLGALASELDARTILVHGLDQWVANRLLDLGDPEDATWGDDVSELGEDLLEEAGHVLRLARVTGWTLILVSNELGSESSLLANQPLGRAFQDLTRDLNHAMSAAADGVFTVVAGIPVELKRPSEVVI